MRALEGQSLHRAKVPNRIIAWPGKKVTKPTKIPPCIAVTYFWRPLSLSMIDRASIREVYVVLSV